MTARAAVLGRIRAALGDGALVPVIPRGYRVGGDRETAAVPILFAERVGEYRATVHQASTDSLPAVVATILAGSGATRVVVPPGLPAAWLAAVAPVITVLTDDGAITADELDGSMWSSPVARSRSPRRAPSCWTLHPTRAVASSRSFRTTTSAWSPPTASW